jgi:hypothetical protein
VDKCLRCGAGQSTESFSQRDGWSGFYRCGSEQNYRRIESHVWLVHVRKGSRCLCGKDGFYTFGRWLQHIQWEGGITLHIHNYLHGVAYNERGAS